MQDFKKLMVWENSRRLTLSVHSATRKLTTDI